MIVFAVESAAKTRLAFFRFHSDAKAYLAAHDHLPEPIFRAVQITEVHLPEGTCVAAGHPAHVPTLAERLRR